MPTPTTTQTLHLPKALFNYWKPKRVAEKKIAEAVALVLFAGGKITASRGAELLGIPLQDFFDLMHKHGLTLWDDTPAEIRQGLRNLRKVLKKNKKAT